MKTDKCWLHGITIGAAQARQPEFCFDWSVDHYGAPEGTRKLKSFECLDCTNNKVSNVATAQTIKF